MEYLSGLRGGTRKDVPGWYSSQDIFFISQYIFRIMQKQFRIIQIIV